MSEISSRVPSTIKTVGIVSFLINTSTLMIFSLFGLYLHNELHIDFSRIGFLDGTIEALSYITKICSGILSDVLMNRKILYLLGAILLFVAKPLEAIATNYWALFQAKILERVGNGLQSTPRDAIVGDWAPKEYKATCFGIRQSFAAFGAVLGAILAMLIFKLSGEDYQFVFWMATIPSFFAVCLIIAFVKDKPNEIKSSYKSCPKYRKIRFNEIKNLGREYWMLICVACTYMVSKVSESIVILYVLEALGLPKSVAPVCMIIYQLGNGFVPVPAGMLSDKLKSREALFIIGMIIFLLSDILFIFSTNLFMIIVALLCLGMYIGITQSIFPAKIVDLVSPDLKGTGIGVYNLVCALSLLTGGTLAGYMADTYSLKHSFIVSSCLAIISLVLMLKFNKILQRKKS